MEVRLLPTGLRSFRRLFLIATAAFFIAGTLFSGPAQAQSVTKSLTALRTLTKANEVHSLSSEEAKRAYPIHLRAVITYYDPSMVRRPPQYSFTMRAEAFMSALPMNSRLCFPPER